MSINNTQSVVWIHFNNLAGTTLNFKLHTICSNTIINSYIEWTGEYNIITIVEIRKKRDKKDCTNYRPISLEGIIAKILEKIVKNQRLEYHNTWKAMVWNDIYQTFLV